MFSEQEKVRIDVLKRFGFYSTESNGHLSSTSPGTASGPRRSPAGSRTSEWIHGETGGYLRYSTENRNWFETDFPQFLKEADAPLSGYERTDEHASLDPRGAGDGPHLPRPLQRQERRGHHATCPPTASSRSPGFVDRFGINMVEGVTLPLACAATCNVSVSVQRMSVRAAQTGDLDLLKQAVLHDPLVGAILNPEEVWQMVDEMVVAQAQWLPQYADAIPGARERMKAPKVKTREWEGAARLHVRSVDELREAKGRKAASEGHGLGTKVMG